jgi:hypothetical protein
MMVRIDVLGLALTGGALRLTLLPVVTGGS